MIPILFVGFAFRLLGIRLPSTGEALARLERDNQLRHRPATSWLDTLALGADNPDSRTLWIAHKSRLKRELDALKSHLPRSPLPARDPMALRNGLALGLVAALFLNAGDWRDRVSEAVSLDPMPAVPARIDAPGAASVHCTSIEPLPSFADDWKKRAYLKGAIRLDLAGPTILELRLRDASRVMVAADDPRAFTAAVGTLAR